MNPPLDRVSVKSEIPSSARHEATIVSRKSWRNMEPPSKRRRPSRDVCARSETPQDEDTDLKLALLTSMHPDRSQDVLLDYLLAYNGSVEEASTGLNGGLRTVSVRKSSTGYQSSLSTFVGSKSSRDGFTTAKLLTKKGRTLHLYSPEDVEANTPCSIIHNFLPSADAEAVLRELMSEVTTFRRDKFQMFEREVESPHTSRFYVDSLDEQEQQKTQVCSLPFYQERARMFDSSHIVYV